MQPAVSPRLAHVVAALMVLGLLAPAPPAASAASDAGHQGARMESSKKHRDESLRCIGDPTGTGPVPVLLVHGTALTAAENWSTSYQPALVLEGHAVCTISLPRTGTGDLQKNIEYVASAIRSFHVAAGRPISVIGHSQGATLPRHALRVWPDLAARVDDVIGLAGVYDRGSEGLVTRCESACIPAMHQMARGSKLLKAIKRRDLPEGPSYTNIGTLGDTTVTPQPAANRQRGAVSVHVQDVCPGRTIPISEHGLIAGDAVAKALVDDAFAHPGPARARRIPESTCAQIYYVGFAPNPFIESAPFIKERLYDTTRREIAVRCHLRLRCSKAVVRGRLIEDQRRTVARKTITWTGEVTLSGRVRIKAKGTRTTRRVTPGPLTLTVRRPKGADRMVLMTRPDRYRVWAREDLVRLR